MSKKIEILAVESGVRAVAELYEKEAPKNCAAMWECLAVPMETQGIHAMWVGRELMFLMPEENQRVDPETIPLENATQYPLPGDVLFKYYPAHIERQPFGVLQQDKPIWDLFIIYGPDPILGSEVTVWAHIIEGLDALAGEAAKIREEGTKLFRVSRLEE